MEKTLWIAASMGLCVVLAACEPRGTPQKPKMAEPVVTLPADRATSDGRERSFG